MCKYSDDWSPLDWPEMRSWNKGEIPFEEQHIFRVQSIYDVYCNKCNKFVNLLDGKEINPDGRVVYKG